jgi:hypothetical protein
MKTVSSYVDDFMKEYPFLSKFLRQGIINYKALARFIEPDISKMKGEKVSTGAIAVSLQRMHQRDQHKLESLIGRLRGVQVVTGLIVFAATDQMPMQTLYSRALKAGESFQDPFILPIGSLLFVEKMVAKELSPGVGLPAEARYTALIVERERLHETEVGGLSYPLLVLAEHGLLVKAVSATFSQEVIIVDEAIADSAASVLRHAMWR